MVLRRSWIPISLCCPQCLCSFDNLVECNPNEHGQRMMSVLPNQRLSDVLSTLDPDFVPFLPLLKTSTYTYKNNPCDVAFWPDNLCCVRGCSAMSSRSNRKDQRLHADCRALQPTSTPSVHLSVIQHTHFRLFLQLSLAWNT